MELKFTKQYAHLLSTDNGRCGPNGLRNFWTVILFSLKYALISQILYSIIKLIKGFLGPSPGLYMWQHWISIYWINAWKNPDIYNICHPPLHTLSMLSFLLYRTYKSHIMETVSLSDPPSYQYTCTISISIVYFLTQWKQCLSSATVNRSI